MNWFQRLWATPKFHAGLTLLGTIATALAPPPWNMVAMTVAGLSGANAAILPHQDITPIGTAVAPGSVIVPPAIVPGPVVLPASASPHAADYVNALLPALGLPAVPMPATGSLHQGNYAAIILALTAAMKTAPPAPAEPIKTL